MAEYKTNCFEKKPIKGGIPAIENKQILKLIAIRGFEKNKFFNSDIKLISLIKEFIFSLTESILFIII